MFTNRKFANIDLVAITTLLVIALFFSSRALANEHSSSEHLSSEEVSSCGGECHILDSYIEGAKHNSKLLAYRHQENWQLTCIDCHQRSEETIAHEKRVYQSGEYQSPFYRREFSNDLCLQCHDDYDGLIERTGYFEDEGRINPHRNHRRQTDCSNCHRVHRRSRFSCSECHKSDSWGEMLPEGWQIAD